MNTIDIPENYFHAMARSDYFYQGKRFYLTK